MAFLKKPAPSSSSGVGVSELRDKAFADLYPTLAAFMSQDAWEDSSGRQTGTMFLFCEVGRWKLMLKDRDGGRISFWTADSISELFTAVERSLDEDCVAWKADRKPAGRRG